MANFKYDIVTLIELVESKPCIWDKTNENNKNKVLRERSWQEIFRFLENGYEEMSQAEKKKTGEVIMQKWTHIRDAFMRSLKTKSGQGAKRKYLYREHLNFLLKIAQKDETESNFSQADEADEETMENEDVTESQIKSTASSSQASLPSKERPLKLSKRKLDPIEREILAELKKGNQSATPEPSSHKIVPCTPLETASPPDHEILLLSFRPYTRDMSEIELMDLQMEILNSIKSIKGRRTSSQRIQFDYATQHQQVQVQLSSPLSCSAYQNNNDYQCTSPLNQQGNQMPTQSYPSPPQTNYENKFRDFFDHALD